MTAVTATLLEVLDGLECSDEDRALVLGMALLSRARAARGRAGALVAGRSGPGPARLRRLAGASMALAEAHEALELAERVARLLGRA